MLAILCAKKIKIKEKHRVIQHIATSISIMIIIIIIIIVLIIIYLCFELNAEDLINIFFVRFGSSCTVRNGGDSAFVMWKKLRQREVERIYL